MPLTYVMLHHHSALVTTLFFSCCVGGNKRFDYVFVGVTIFASNFSLFPNAFLVWHLNFTLARASTHLKLGETKIF